MCPPQSWERLKSPVQVGLRAENPKMKFVFNNCQKLTPSVTSLSPYLGKMGIQSDLLIIGTQKYACRLIWAK